MISDEDQKILDTAEKLKPILASEGWQYIQGAIAVQDTLLKNTLAKMDLTKELNAASRKQGEIEGIHRIPNKIDKTMALADKIREAEAIKKKEKK